MEELKFLFDSEKVLPFEVESEKKIQLLELMLELPFNVLLKRNIYDFLKQNYAEIKMSKILTESEEKVLDSLNDNYPSVEKFFEKYDEEYKKLGESG